jgi:hypothetical protein
VAIRGDHLEGGAALLLFGGVKEMQRLATLSLAEISAPDVLAFHRYWQSLQAGQPMPAKSAFDPTRIPSLLPFITLEELHGDPPRVFYRVVGSEQAHFSAGDYTGKWLDELDWQPSLKQQMLAQYTEIRRLKEPLFGLSQFVWHDGLEKVFEWGLFPFSEDGITVTHVVTVEDFRHVSRERIRDRLREHPPSAD